MAHKIPRARKTPKPGQVLYITVAHDDTCPIFTGRACTCQPDVGLPDELPAPTSGEVLRLAMLGYAKAWADGNTEFMAESLDQVRRVLARLPQEAGAEASGILNWFVGQGREIHAETGLLIPDTFYYAVFGDGTQPGMLPTP
jgi:hypothetical protein